MLSIYVASAYHSSCSPSPSGRSPIDGRFVDAKLSSLAVWTLKKVFFDMLRLPATLSEENMSPQDIA